MRFVVALLICLVWFIDQANGQERTAQLKLKLTAAESVIGNLEEKIDFRSDGLDLKEVLYSIGTAGKINISADNDLSVKVYASFNDVSISDILLFLCVRHELDFSIQGNILFFTSFKAPVQNRIKVPEISKDSLSNLYSFQLNRDTLKDVLKGLTDLSGVNFIISQYTRETIVTSAAKGVGFVDALNILLSSADLRSVQIDSTLYRIERKEINAFQPPGVASNTSISTNSSTPKVVGSSTEITIRKENGSFRFSGNNVSYSSIVKQGSELFAVPYVIIDELKGTATFDLTASDFERFLELVFSNSSYGFSNDENIFIIGDRLSEKLRTSKLVVLYSRSITGILEQIPSELRKRTEIKPFPELNGFLVSGSRESSSEVEEFLMLVDKRVPLIDIEVFIVDVNDSRTVSTGIEAGLRSTGSETSGKLYPGTDVELNSNTVNELMAGVSKFGLFNLGRVGTGFYLKLKMLEEQGLLKIRSTPRLATLNGHEAKMRIGSTEYYLELQNNVIGTQNPQNLFTQQYKSVNADLAVTINPFVSEDQEITLNIQVSQSNFTERISPGAPPGTISRDFQSTVRVRNEEMIILGGLEENTKSGNSSGIPLLSRIPVIKWFFSSRVSSKSKSQLTIFIKPTVIY